MPSGLSGWLGARVDASSIAAFRLALGGVMALESLRLLVPREGRSTLEALFLSASVRVPYPGLELVMIERPALLLAVALAVGVSGVALALGIVPRLAAAGVAAGWTTVWLQDATLYNNHHYLMSLLAGLLVFAPGAPSLLAPGAWRARPTVAFASIALLRLQLALTYFYAGVAKCTVTWWVHAEPLRTHLSLPATSARLAWLPTEAQAFVQSEALAHALSRSGLVVDLFVGPLLLWRPARLLAAGVLVAFHGTNHFVLFDDIGLFPLLGVLTLPIFFDPDWPRRITGRGDRRAPAEAVFGPGTLSPIAVTACVAFAAVQLLLPLRHFLIPGNVDWTGQGGRFAWRMKSRAMRPGSFGIELLDAGVLKATNTGRQSIDWQAWPEPRWEMREVDPFDPRWPERPRQVVVWHPLAGERLLLNPYANAEHGGLKAEDVPPVEPGPARPARTRDAILQELDGLAPTAGLLELAARIDRAPSRPDARAASALLRTSIDRLARDAKDGARVRALLREARPFELEGGPHEDAAFAILEAPLVPAADLPGFPRLAGVTGAPRLVVRGAGDPRMHVALPRGYVRRRLDGRHRIEWNPAAELSSRALGKIRADPGVLHTYVDGVASRWEQQTARRPAIRVDAFAALAPYPPQRLIDPAADLATVPWPLGDARWIETLTPGPRNPPSQK